MIAVQPSIKKLGFGFMQLPKHKHGLDLPAIKNMVDDSLNAGINYFDVSDVYSGGLTERAAKAALVDRHNRENYKLASKLPIKSIISKADMSEAFATSLSWIGTDYLDYYTVNGLDSDTISTADELDVWQFGQSLKQRGYIKQFGISYFGKATILERVLKEHPELDYVQIRINYMDWYDESSEVKACYRAAHKYNKPIVAVEPFKNNSLIKHIPEIEDIFHSHSKSASNVSWALRFIASLKDVALVQAPLSSAEHVAQSIATFQTFTPLDIQEHEVVKQAAATLNAEDIIPCTNCKYCLPECPGGAHIPKILTALNNYKLYGNYEREKSLYDEVIANGSARASDCISCGSCVQLCPQHINIIELLKEAVLLFETQPE